MIMVNQRVRFDAFEHIKATSDSAANYVTGTVYGVNYKHQVFHVVYDIHGIAQRTSFKFADIGNSVTICKK